MDGKLPKSFSSTLMAAPSHYHYAKPVFDALFGKWQLFKAGQASSGTYHGGLLSCWNCCCKLLPPGSINLIQQGLHAATGYNLSASSVWFFEPAAVQLSSWNGTILKYATLFSNQFLYLMKSGFDEQLLQFLELAFYKYMRYTAWPGTLQGDIKAAGILPRWGVTWFYRHLIMAHLLVSNRGKQSI